MLRACAVGTLRSEDISFLAKASAAGAPIGYWIGKIPAVQSVCWSTHVPHPTTGTPEFAFAWCAGSKSHNSRPGMLVGIFMTGTAALAHIVEVSAGEG